MDSSTDKLRLVVPSDFKIEVARDSEESAHEQRTRILEKRRCAAKQAKISASFRSASTLSKTAQDHLMETLLAHGWGKCPHGLTRMLKCPRKFRLKLADISILATIYDLTVASVSPSYFVPLSAQEIQNETEMDLRDVRRVLGDLCSRGILLKIALKGINFWALNPHFFVLSDGGKAPVGNSPRGNAPSVKKGDLPMIDPGKIAQGELGSSDGNSKENSVAKNLFQESLKESHLTTEFPNDMLERWKLMTNNGQNLRAEKEREIFKSLLGIHKQNLFEKCGRVVAYLEKFGLTKDGKHQPIHSPMSYIQNHWDINLARFEEWTAKENTKAADAARKLDEASKDIAERVRRDREEALALATKKKNLDAAADRFLELYHDVKRIDRFAVEALKTKDVAYLYSFYTKYGWKHPLVREVVLDHFLKVESGERTSEVNPEPISETVNFNND